jgi:glycerol-3-phosphate O-acyltransferase / dihydroxyacetone phosphate acyltransferase
LSHAETVKPSPLYRLLKPLARLLARLFHRRLAIEHSGRVPDEGPLVVAANHPNMMLDVLLLGASTSRELHFLAKATLFRNPLLARFLSAAGVLPVHRRRDEALGGDTGTGTGNVATFAACHELLANGGAIAIFPEGVSHERDFVLPLKTGCARIVLEAESRRGFTLGSRIVPVGIAFSNRQLFRSDALVAFGEPIDPSPHFPAYREGREADAVRALTLDLEQALRGLALHVPREEDEKLLETLRQFFAGTEIPERLDVDRALVDAVSDYRDRRPLDYSRLRREVLAYGRALEVLRVTHGDLARIYRPGPVIRFLLPRLLLAVAGLVPFLAGTALHYLPYSIPRWVAEARATEPVEVATIKLFTGLLSFPIAYGLVGWVVAHFFGAGMAVALVALLPALGLFTLGYLERASELVREARIFLLHLSPDERVTRLKAWRERLTAELDQRRDDYLSSRTLEKQLEG